MNRLKEKTCAITQSQNRLDALTGDWVMDDHYCPSALSLQPKHLSSYEFCIEIINYGARKCNKYFALASLPFGESLWMASGFMPKGSSAFSGI